MGAYLSQPILEKETEDGEACSAVQATLCREQKSKERRERDRVERRQRECRPPTATPTSRDGDDERDPSSPASLSAVSCSVRPRLPRFLASKCLINTQTCV